MKIKTYELLCHWKQGDELSWLLERHPHPQTALLKWAEKMETNAANLRRLATLFKEKELHIDADTHYIELSGDEKALEQAVAEQIINLYETEYYDEDFYDEFEFDSSLSEKVSFAREREHTCFSCNKTLTFDEYNSINLHEFSQEQLLDLWSNDFIRFYCCECLAKLKCPLCEGKLEPLQKEDGHGYYYCARCINDIVDEICHNSEIQDTNILVRKILRLNKVIINLND
ncbi:MAG: hypothetical protein BAJALOKI1v1_70036 [Promethearchaeota archaeon]|nr:MAG: hypothetical protein BAJALOKI1v1_70036 [Candidatus Lokiarchaeota archaeon]